MEIEEKVREIVAASFCLQMEDLTLDTHFIDDLNGDSLDTIEVIMELEEELDIKIPDDDADKIMTIGQVVEYVRGKMDEAKQP